VTNPDIDRATAKYLRLRLDMLEYQHRTMAWLYGMGTRAALEADIERAQEELAAALVRLETVKEAIGA